MLQRRFATTVFSSAKICSIVATQFQHCKAVQLCKLCNCCTKNRRCESSRATSPLHLSVIVTCVFMVSLFLSVFSRDSLRAEIHNKEVQLQKEKEIIIARCDRHFLNCPLMFCFVLSFTLTYFRNRPMSSLNNCSSFVVHLFRKVHKSQVVISVQSFQRNLDQIVRKRELVKQSKK